MMNQREEYQKEIDGQVLATSFMQHVQTEIVTNLPYFNRAVLRLPIVFFTPSGQSEAAVSFGTDGKQFYAVASIVLQLYEQGENQVIRLYLHSMMHCLYQHLFFLDDLDEQYWNLATDIAVEGIILQLDFPSANIEGDEVRRRVWNEITTLVGSTTAKGIYQYLMEHEEARKTYIRYAWMFRQDRHDLWMNQEKKQTNKEDFEEDWKKAAKEVKNDAQTYEKTRGYEPGTITKKLQFLYHKKQDYSSLLKKFMVYQEEIKPDLDSFDYIYYTYGLQLYHKMPLIEPLEYQVNQNIVDFVIAIDTSGSTEGNRVRNFIQKTYDIMKQENTFSKQMNVVILQCDAKIQEKVILHNTNEFEKYMKDFTVKGMGGTDFRPVFEEVQQMREQGILPTLRGMLYFTDGHGIFPTVAPGYPCGIVMLDDQQEQVKIPTWAIRMIVESETFE